MTETVDSAATAFQQAIDPAQTSNEQPAQRQPATCVLATMRDDLLKSKSGLSRCFQFACSREIRRQAT